MSGIKFPLTLSIAGHSVCLALLLVFLSDKAPPVPEPAAKGGIEVLFQPALPNAEAAPLPEPALQPETPPLPAETPPPPESQAEVVPPLPEAPAIVAEPTPPASEAPVAAIELTPPPKPAVKKPPKPVQRHEERPQSSQAYLPSPQAAVAPPQTASAATPVPAPLPSPDVSSGYDAAVSAWLNSHKRYPDSARRRGEEGRAVLHFEIDSSGRVLDYTVVKSSGFPDLDGAIDEMMRGAMLPPFPASITQLRKEYTVNVRFTLER